jgi:hypothetical protein
MITTFIHSSTLSCDQRNPFQVALGIGRGTIDLGRCLLAVDVENGEVLVFDEDAFVPDPDGWARAEPKQADVMAVEFVLGTPDPPNNNVER